MRKQTVKEQLASAREVNQHLQNKVDKLEKQNDLLFGENSKLKNELLQQRQTNAVIQEYNNFINNQLYAIKRIVDLQHVVKMTMGLEMVVEKDGHE